MKAVIIDGYVDEPAVLGVPPYVSTYIRYAAGALMFHGIEVDYYTIDQIRNSDLWKAFNNYEYIIIISGTTVPGHYFRGTPISIKEIKNIFSLNKNPLRVLGGPITKGYTITGGKAAIELKKILENTVDFLVEGSIEKFLFDYPVSDNYSLKDFSDYDLIDLVSNLGAEILKKHPFYPDIIPEIEISKGCDRKEGFCSFCTEPMISGKYKERTLKSIITELNCISNVGVKNIRFGRSANFLAYGMTFNNFKPNSNIFEQLYSSIKDDFEIIHTDNANPFFIVDHEKEVRKILEIITKYNSSGDILSFGVETFDSKVSKANNIINDPKKALKAIEIVNEIGSVRDKNNIPKLLPGINILYGLLNEDDETYKINMETFDHILKKDLLLRRVNVRQVMAFPGTMLYNKGNKKINKKLFLKFKDYMKEFDKSMLEKVFPIGTKINNIIVEKQQGNISFGRPLGTYPILCGSNDKKNLYSKFNGIVVDHGSRSLTVIPENKKIFELSNQEISSIKGFSKKTANKIKFDMNIDFLDDDRIETLKNLKLI
ncbi:radical SAM protein [Oceanotoga teriensis]|uniref:Radical SAM superfamily enzyme with C-terminal helix-hairpin-helix motif n=1 Tax=Oceanotoga teriensis TaxID=515440 RepID=A0AA45HHN3_9BACT|nr:radical SAM protein [Oceanotoga teriensis]MDO7976648.1 radical SAM protein [Oceanotoga teriensis]PWJ85119.1 radical SAM superfamily enzyme with C-terminal helix-hairpin-helix motif [Oceanotoga teriensis]